MHTDQSPESVYRRFCLALLHPDEPTIRKLIMDREDADILWKEGSYPDDVAAILASQYRDMTIERIEDKSTPQRSNRVLLRSSNSSIPIAVVNCGGTWRVDASLHIEMRKKAAEIRRRASDVR